MSISVLFGAAVTDGEQMEHYQHLSLIITGHTIEIRVLCLLTKGICVLCYV